MVLRVAELGGDAAEEIPATVDVLQDTSAVWDLFKHPDVVGNSSVVVS